MTMIKVPNSYSGFRIMYTTCVKDVLMLRIEENNDLLIKVSVSKSGRCCLILLFMVSNTLPCFLILWPLFLR